MIEFWREYQYSLTHWGRVTHICVSNLTVIGSENGLSPDRRQAIIWTNAVILIIGRLGTNFYEILSEIHTFSFIWKCRLKMALVLSRSQCVNSICRMTMACVNGKKWTSTWWSDFYKAIFVRSKIFNISRTKSQNLNVSRLVLLLFLCNSLKPGVNG